MKLNELDELLDYIKKQELVLSTAESCTAGAIISTIANHGNCGECLCIGYVVYSRNAKKKQLGVKEFTITKHTLTSEEVAREMAEGVFQLPEINAAIATTGITGDKSMDGIPPGTICTAWGFKKGTHFKLFSDTQSYTGSTKQITRKAVHHALKELKNFHQLFLNEIEIN